MNPKKHLPIYQHFIQSVKTGFNILDVGSQQQILAFINSQQHKNGGFTDRAGNPDLYYSLFGFWLCSALDLKHLVEMHKSFITSQLQDQKGGTIDQMALMLISIGLFNKPISIFSVLKKAGKGGGKIDLSYRFFLLMLTIDAQYGQNAIINFIGRIWLLFYKPPGNIPCSIMAAFTFAKKQVGLNFEKEQRNLLSFFEKGIGFKAFEHVKTGDILSTAVALFVLQDTEYDLRLIAPDCLNFVEQNYNSGAFLSGDGDQSRDLEYTFYGLLALGTLINGYDK